MRIRELDTQAPDDFDPSPETETQRWNETFEVKMITPIFGGGVEATTPDRELPVRGTAIRGQLRFWWRFLATNGDELNINWQDIFEKERNLWGGMSENDKDFSSKVKIRINNIKGKKIVSEKNEYPPYASFSLREKETEISRNRDHRKLVEEGLTFNLVIECPNKYKEEVYAAFRWWVSFGGVGARTRRGFGALEILDKENRALKVTAQETQSFGCKLIEKKSVKSALVSWQHTIEKLHKFRQGKIGRGKNGFGKSYWPEPDSIRETTNQGSAKHPPQNPARVSFPRAVFGLPIQFKFIGDEVSGPPFLKPRQFERMASPIILKPMALGKGEYASILLCLPVKHLENLELELTYLDGRETKSAFFQRSEDAGWWPLDKEKASTKADYPNSPIKKYNGHDAISSFINYFKSK